MTTSGIAVVWLPVGDLDRALAFYRDTLGLSENRREQDWAHLDAGGLRIGLNAHESPSGDGGAVIAFQAQPDIDAAVGRLRDAGVDFAGEITDHPWGRVATFKDPDGNDLQLYQPPNHG